jgi:hypothetical protein
METETETQIEVKHMTRYDKLKLILEELEIPCVNKSPEWYDKHYDILTDYRSNFINFNNIDSEIHEVEFRQKANLVEILLTKLMSDYESHRWFGLYDYIRLNNTLVWMAEYSRDHHESKSEKELSKLFDGLKF